jgi:DNA ligase-1
MVNKIQPEPIKSPMLAGKIDDKNIKELKYPGLVTYKLDGIRCLIIKGKAVSRNLKPIRNDYIRNILESEAEDGFDGELLTGTTFTDVASGVMSKEGRPDFKYMVFDYMITPDEPYYKRMRRLSSIPETKYIKRLLPIEVHTEKQLLDFEAKSLEHNFEGVMWRNPYGPYLFGRSSFRDQYLLKLKRFDDDEAIIVGFKQEVDIHGKPKNTLGGLLVKDVKTGIKFHVGSGLDKELKQKIWDNQEKYLGKMITYRSQKHGAKTAPRFPTFANFRDPSDLDKKRVFKSTQSRLF